MKLKVIPLVFSLLMLGYFVLVARVLMTHGGLEGGGDGYAHLSTIQEQIRAFQKGEGAANFASTARYVGDCRPMFTYQGFYWYSGFLGYLFHLNAYDALLLSLILIPALCFLISYASFSMIPEKGLRTAAAFLYSTSPMITGLTLFGAAWPTTFSALFLPLVILGCWRLWKTHNAFLLFGSMSLLLISHPITAIITCSTVSIFCIYVFLKSPRQRLSLLGQGILGSLLVLLSNAYIFSNLGSGFELETGGGRSSGLLRTIRQTVAQSRSSRLGIHFSQFFTYPSRDPAYSVGVIGVGGIFLSLLCCFRFRKKLNEFQWFVIVSALFFSFFLLPIQWPEIYLKYLLFPLFPASVNLFSNRFVPSAMIFLVLTFTVAWRIIQSSVPFSQKSMISIAVVFLTIHCVQSFSAIHMPFDTALTPDHIYNDVRPGIFFRPVPDQFFSNFLTPSYKTELRPIRNVFIQPPRLWRWKSSENPTWQQAKWVEKPYIDLRPPFNWEGSVPGDFRKGIVGKDLVGEPAVDLFLPTPPLARGVYQLEILYRVVEVSKVATPPFVAYLVTDHFSEEAAIEPDPVRFPYPRQNLQIVEKVPFQMDTKYDAPRFKFRFFSQNRIQIDSIIIRQLSELPFQVSDYKSLSFRVPHEMLKNDLRIDLPKYYIPGYTLKLNTSSSNEIAHPLSESEQGTLEATIPKSSTDVQAELTFTPPNPWLRYRISSFLLGFSLLVVLSFVPNPMRIFHRPVKIRKRERLHTKLV